MGAKCSLAPNSTRDRDDDASHDGFSLFSLHKENHDSTYMIAKRKFPTSNEVNEMNEKRSWKRYEVPK
jgi:hypothetical protein|tara:strand:- start:344 stop:547 length:204 start_codon:yes stop_codon:yes gene_type:complete